ncbi:Smr/MutS family protein [Frigidibacter mobilis]|uniref:Smr protein/MutS2 n=1 Tax=Frigidibacter mobilis TaxID=1335048 RepID=A0A159ZAA3_9RHOB|nr:Smr/MutS family protein [Frigidibacter mobilis]AMY71724.1 Smr protein/MutS2 [Frigidibacter mobilis]
MTRRPRGLRPEERELWQRIAASAQPLHPGRPAADPVAAHPPAHQVPQVDVPRKKPRPDVQDFRIGQSAPDLAFRMDLAPSITDRLSAAPLRMDHKTHKTMTRGRLEPEARIDLHGMTLAEAHPELTHFILRSATAGRRLVLVITGKGKRGLDNGPIPQRQGVLRHQVPQWLTMPPLGALVLQVVQAHLKHGGAGAYYVYLRRGR